MIKYLKKYAIGKQMPEGNKKVKCCSKMHANSKDPCDRQRWAALIFFSVR
jgi:hypothetical protein